jgi:GR25 family glycosyltransferase involved in LPS biosynthesis
MTEYIDHILYINLEHRTDRLEEIQRELVKMDLSDKAERFEATYIKEQGILGCTISHMEAIRLAKNRGYKNVLILEDDFDDDGEY